MMAYLAMMAVRLIELHRVLKPTGSCICTAIRPRVYYLKLILDSVFGARLYRNEIIWKRTSAHSNVLVLDTEALPTPYFSTRRMIVRLGTASLPS